MNRKVDARGEKCPVPLVKARKAAAALEGAGTVEILVDEEIAVQNLEKMAAQKQYGFARGEGPDGSVSVTLTVNGTESTAGEDDAVECTVPSGKQNTVVVLSSNKMGEGNEELAKTLMKGFLYALAEQEVVPSCVLLYNSGVRLSTENDDAVHDLRALEEAGAEILSCGTCLNFYGLTDKLRVGSVTNMYAIVEKMMAAGKLVKPF